WAKRALPTTWSMGGTRHFSRARERRAWLPAMDWACWWSRQPSPSSCGAAFGLRRGSCSSGSVRRRRRPGLLGTARRLLLWAFGVAALAVVALQLWYFGHVLYWNRYDPSTSAFIERSMDVLRAKKRS